MLVGGPRNKSGVTIGWRRSISNHGECRSDYMWRGFKSRLAERLVAQLDRAIDVRPIPGRLDESSIRRMPRGTTSCHDGPPKGPSHAFFVAGTTNTLTNAGGTTGQSTCRKAGGRRSDSASGKPDSSGKCLTNPGRQHQNKPANAGGTTLVTGGSNPPRSDPEMSRRTFVAGTEMQPWRMPRGTTLLMRRSPVRIRPG